MKSLLMESAIIGVTPVVCILGVRDSDDEEACEALKAAISNPLAEDSFKIGATGVTFSCGEEEYKIIARSMEPIVLFKKIIKSNRLQVEPCKRDHLEGFSICAQG